jgi:hypothetical protein
VALPDQRVDDRARKISSASSFMAARARLQDQAGMG